MNDVINLCPNCLTELPDDYPYDHVAIDYALDGQPGLFRAMDREERREVLLEGRRHGISDQALATRFGISWRRVQLLADPHWTDGRRNRPHPHDDLVRALWKQGLSDRAIAPRIGLSHAAITVIRKRLGLPAHYRYGRRITTEAA